MARKKKAISEEGAEVPKKRGWKRPFPNIYFDEPFQLLTSKDPPPFRYLQDADHIKAWRFLVRRYQPYKVLRREHWEALIRYVDHWLMLQSLRKVAATWPTDDPSSTDRQRVYTMLREAEKAMDGIAKTIGIDEANLSSRSAALQADAGDEDGDAF